VKDIIYIPSNVFAKINDLSKKIAKLYIYYCCGGWRQGPTAVPHGVRYTRGTVASATAVGHGGRGPICFKKFVIFLFELGWR
jgi:hypothetical protein